MGRPLAQRSTERFALGHLRPTVPENEVRRHLHEDVHLVVLLAGHYVSEARGMPGVCSAPALVLNPPGTEHRDRFRSAHGRFLSLSLSPAAFESIAGPCGSGPRRLPPTALGLGLRLLRELAHWDDASPLATEAVLAELPGALDQADALDRAGSAALRRARSRLDDDLRRLPDVAELAALAGMHPVAFARSFRRAYGAPPSEVVRAMRLPRAVARIVRGRPLAAIAPEVGYVDDSHLHRSFVAAFGITPAALHRLALGPREVSRIQDALLRRC